MAVRVGIKRSCMNARGEELSGTQHSLTLLFECLGTFRLMPSSVELSFDFFMILPIRERVPEEERKL